MNLRSLFGRTASTLLMLSLAACGGGGGGDSSPASFTIGGAVTGLAAGAQIVLNDNGNDPLTVNANAAFTFVKPVAANGSYLVTITTQPSGQSCSVANFQGAGVTANVANVNITCSAATHTIAGTVTGLAAGQNVVLNNNGADPTAVSADGAFAFVAPVAFNGSYAVTVGTQPTGQMCTVSNGSGAGVVADVTDVAVTCSTNTYTIGGAVTGLASGQQVTLNNNASDPLTINADGTFTFPTAVSFNGGYAVTVGTQPTGQTCTVAGGSGAGVTASVSNVAVTCSTSTFTIGGTVTGLAAGQQVTLNNNGANPKTVTANGAFTFSTPVNFNGSYAVTVGTQPTGQTCSVSTGTGAGVTANVTTANISCSTNTFTVGGTVTGLASGQQVTLFNNGGNAKTVTANGAYTFSTPVNYNGSYAVTVGTQPTGQTCSVSTGTGAGVTANVTTANISCSINSYTIGGTVTGLASGQQVTLFNNGGNAKIVTANGAYTFSTPVNYNGSYAVTVNTQPTGQTCSVTTGTGAGVTANVTTANISCSTNTYTIGGTVTGLASGQQVTLFNNGGNAKIVTANGVYTFSTPVNYNGSYAVTVNTQPTGQTCSVTAGAGAGVTANVTTANISCSTNSYTVGGTVTGLASGQQVTLFNNGGNAKIVTANGSYTFSTPVNYNGSYAVTVNTQPTGQTCTVSNGTGSVTANVTTANVTCSTNTYTISGTVSGLVATQQVTLNNNSANPTTVAADGTFTFSTPVNSGTNYAVTVGTQPTGETCRIAGGSGTNVTANVSSVVVTCRLALAYVVNSTDNTVSQYTIGLDGALTPLGTPIDTGGTDPNVVTVDPTGRFAYVTNFGSNTVAQFSIDAATGALSSLGTVPTGGLTPYSVAVDPTGRYVYVTNQDDSHGQGNSVAQFAIGSDGRLTAIGSGIVPLPAGRVPYQITVDPSGRHAYVANKFSGNETGTGSISQFDIDAATGALTLMTQVASDNWSIGIAINPAGTFAYVSNIGVNTVSQFSIDSVTGVLTPSVGNTQLTENRPYPMAISADGQFAYWANKGSDSVSQCKINTDGSLPSGTNTTGAGNHPQYVAIDPFSRHVYVVNVADAGFVDGQGSTVSQYTIDPATGAVAPITGAATVPTGLGPFSITTTR